MNAKNIGPYTDATVSTKVDRLGAAASTSIALIWFSVRAVTAQNRSIADPAKPY